MKTPELPPIEYRPTFRLDSSGLVVTSATQDEWDSAVKALNAEHPSTAASIAVYPQVQCWRCKEIGHTRDMDYHVCQNSQPRNDLPGHASQSKVVEIP